MTSGRDHARLSKIEAMVAGATTPGERAAAQRALRRVQARLGQEQRSNGSRAPYNDWDLNFKCAKWRRSKRTRDARGRWTTQSSYGDGQPRAHDADEQERDDKIGMTFRLGDLSSKHLFLAIARQHRLKPHRNPGWPALTFALEGPESVLDDVVLELETFGRMLAEQLDQTTRKFILENVHSGITDAVWCRWRHL